MIKKRFTKKGEPRYEVRLRRPDGSEYSRTFRILKQAEDYQATQRADKARGVWIDPNAGKISFKDWAEEWYEANRRSWRIRTAEKHEMALRVHWIPIFGTKTIASIHPRQIQQAVNLQADHYAPTTVNTYYATLRSVMLAAVNLDLIPKTPCRNIKLPSNKPAEKRVVEPHEIHALADEIGQHRRCIIYLGGIAGLRIGETLALQLQDLNTERRTLTIERTAVEPSSNRLLTSSSNTSNLFGDTKTLAGIRTISLPLPLIKELQTHIERTEVTRPDELLFQDSIGGQIRRRNFRRREFDPAVKRLDLNGLTFHGLRHSAATQWVKEGIDPKTVQHRLGHSDPRITLMLYAKASNDADAAAADALTAVYWPDETKSE